MLYKISSLFLVIILSVNLFAFAQDADKVIVAKVNDMTITLEDLDNAVKEYNNDICKYGDSFVLPQIVSETMQKKIITTREQEKSFLKNQMVRTMLFCQEALRRQLDKKENEQDILLNEALRYKQDKLVIKLLTQQITDLEVRREEVEDFYIIYRDTMFTEPEERHLYEIVVHSEREAKDIYKKLLENGDFIELAKAHSVSTIAVSGGDLGFIRKGQKNELFDSVAFCKGLKPGGISNIFQLPNVGYCILKLEAIRGGQMKTLSEVEQVIETQIMKLKQKQKIDDLLGRLFREAKIQFYEDKLK